MKILPIAFNNNKKHETFTAVYTDKQTANIIGNKLGTLFNIRKHYIGLGLTSKQIEEIPENLWATSYEFVNLLQPIKKGEVSIIPTNEEIFQRILNLKNNAKDLTAETFNSFIPIIHQIQKTHSDAMTEVKKALGLEQ